MHNSQGNIRLSIVSVNFNGLNDTLALLASLEEHLREFPYEVVVVDNGSTIDEAQTIRTAFPKAVVLRSEKNLGFAGGNNLGIEKAKGEYLFLLNNDTVLSDNGVIKLMQRMDETPSIGIISPKIRFYDDEQPIQFAGYTALTKITLRHNLIGYQEPDNGQYDQAKPTPYVHGAAMLVRRSAIDRAGMIPEIFFLYYEELDWCERFTEVGYTLWYDPASTVFHKESQSTGQNSPLRMYYLTRNRLLFAYRNRSGIVCLAALLYQFALANPLKYLQLLSKRQWKHAASIRKGCYDFFKII